MVAQKVQLVAAGLQAHKTDTEVEMSKPWKIIEHTATQGNELIWTRAMGDCCSVGTFDHDTGERTLCHLPGGQGSDGFFKELARAVSENTTVIIVSGTNTGSEKGFRNTLGNSIYQSLLDALVTKEKKILDAEKWVVFWTSAEADEEAEMCMGSFGITADGKYGRVQNQKRKDGKKK